MKADPVDRQPKSVGREQAKRSTDGLVNNAGNIGRSGIVRKDGTIELFGHDMAHEILSFGPSGIILKNGPPIHLDENLKMTGRSKRHIVGPTGMITSWGQIVQFREPFTTVVSDGPSGIVLSDGQNIQKPAV
ncbi:cuticular protein 34 [Penaeus vannamei]|uniref:Cuticular protein 34 n=1 Tax=Penaeus vannamei TaxID=6689 RepID=A0A423TRP9_PENVA|nr:cuticular protein 34 [Penaeus vannamei]